MANSDRTCRKREISYFGPIYINNSVHLPRDEACTGERAPTYSPLDITKYKIQAPSRETTREDEAKPTHHEISNESSSNNGIVQKCTSPTNGLHDKSIRKPSPNEKRLRRLPDVNHARSKSEDRDARQVADVLHKFNKMLDIDNQYTTPKDYRFKISSTEDNYMYDKFKAKSKLIHEKGDRTENENALISGNEINKTNPDDGHIKTNETNDDSSTPSAVKEPHEIILVNEAKEPKIQNNGKDFLTKHRNRINKLKRRFFESQTTPKALSAENVSLKTKTNENKNTEIPDDIAKDHAPTKSPRKFSSNEHFATESKASLLKNENGLSSERPRRHSADGTLVGNRFEDLRMRWSTGSGQYAVVVAIDFGTTYSGYAYSFTDDPDTIHVMRRQESGDPGVYNQKIPTTILLTPEGSFHSFGYAARDYYHDLDQKEAVKWLYFERFKMMLHNDGVLRQDSVLRTFSGKEISAMTVFSYSLSYFKDLAVQEICDQSGMRITCDVIRWVITVPAIWKASAKQFMRQAACQAGIVTHDQPDHLLIALEPEAASIYCRRLRMFHILSEDDRRSRASLSDLSMTSSLSLPELRSNDVSLVSNDLDIGTRYMVVDCGGGTVDITVHELLENGRLKELQRASGGSHGSVGVDEEFEKLLGSIFGTDIIHHFKRKRPSGWVDLLSMFESRKRTASPYRESQIAVSIPFSFIDFYKKCRGSSVASAIKVHGNPEITWTSNGLLKFSPGVMRRLFLPTVDRIKQSVGSVLNNPLVKDISYLFLVGGFAESSVVQHEMRKDFGSILKLIIPPGVGMTILRGAVCFGQDPNIVKSRCSCLTYGVGVLHRFDPDKHPQDKKVTKDCLDWCTDVFDAFVKVNQSVELGESIIRRYTPVRRDQTATTINIYSTDNEDAEYITDPEVSKCGTLTLTLIDMEPEGPRREIRTEMIFGDTEIHVHALDVTTNHGVEAKIDFFNI